MTTIAWDGKTLAVDSASVSNDVFTSRSAKKMFKSVGRYNAVAITGCLIQMGDFIQWLKDGEKGVPPDSDGSAVCISRDGKAYSYWPKESKSRSLENGVSSNGTGWKIALGAMDAGATAIEAVKISSKRDVFTAGRIQSYTVGE